MDVLRTAMGLFKKQEPKKLISPLPDEVMEKVIKASQQEEIRRKVASGKLISPLPVNEPTEMKVFVPKAQPAPTPQPIRLEGVPEGLLAQNFIPVILKQFGKEGLNAVRVAFNESSLNPRAVGGAGEFGLFQILPKTFKNEKIEKKFGYKFEDMKNPIKNIEVARYLWGKYGWQPWVGAGFLRRQK